MNLFSRLGAAVKYAATGRLSMATLAGGFEGALAQRRLIAWKATQQNLNSLLSSGTLCVLIPMPQTRLIVLSPMPSVRVLSRRALWRTRRSRIKSSRHGCNGRTTPMLTG